METGDGMARDMAKGLPLDEATVYLGLRIEKDLLNVGRITRGKVGAILAMAYDYTKQKEEV